MAEEPEFRTINVKGIGPLKFPADMSNEDIEKAIKEHPQYPKNLAPSWAEKLPGFFGEHARAGREMMEEPGRFVRNMRDASNNPNDHLVRDTALSLGTQALTGPALIPAMLGQGAYGAGSSIYDTIKEKGINEFGWDDAKKAAVKGGIYSLGPFASRLISPATTAIPEVGKTITKNLKTAINRPTKTGLDIPPEVAALMRTGTRQAEEQTSKKAAPEWIGKLADQLTHTATHSAVGGILGGQFGHPIEGMLAGAVTPHLKDITTRAVPAWWNGTTRLPLPNVANLAAGQAPGMSRVPMADAAHHFTTQAILNAIAREGADRVEKASSE